MTSSSLSSSFVRRLSPIFSRPSRLTRPFPTSLLSTPSPSLVFSRLSSTMDPSELKHYLADQPPMIVPLEIEPHFSNLSDQNKRYAHYISKAAFAGTRITLRQLSPEAEPIYDLIIALHNACNGDWDALAQKTGVDKDEVTFFVQYAAQVLANAGNYKSFGDTKFLPRCSEKSVAALATASPDATKFYEATKGGIFSSDSQSKMLLGFVDAGHMTTYYPDSPDITQAEVEAVSSWMEKKGLLPENTRLRKTQDGTFELLIASANTSMPAEGSDIGKDGSYVVEDGPLKGKNIKLVFGDHSKELKQIAAYTKLAAENASNQNQKDMYNAYTKSFETGSLEAFKDSQRFWIRDKSPNVESNMGFVETYRDPAGVRGEWEGFASMVNLERTRAFGELVDASPKIIPLLPWGADFEKDKFMSPDFTSLEVMSFAGASIPAGINIPNYDDIRQTEGFKNVSLGNVLSAKASNEKVPFIHENDLDLYRKHRDSAFEIQVGLHELTGHGCGKLLQETAPGVFNFDKENPPVNPINNKPVTTWYKPGQTWGSVFGATAGSYEECRAELVAMYLSCEFPILKIFGFGDGVEDINNEAGDLLYISYLIMARAGLISVEFWDPKSQKWGQPHMQARFSILKCFLEAGDDFCKLVYTKEDMSDLTIKIDRTKILTSGRKAVGDYLQKIHVYKSAADVEEGIKLYNHMTNVDADYWGSKIRNVVLENKQPRKAFVQANTFLDEATGKVTLKQYEASVTGMIESFADRKL